MGNEMRSLEGLIDCQEGREEISYCQVGKGEKMRLYESLMNSGMSSDQREELVEKDQRNLLIIGGIEIFLPLSPVEMRFCVADATTTKRQLAVTVMMMEQISEAAQAEEKEHLEEWLKIFNQEAEGETAAALKLTVREEEEHADKILTPWEKELEMLEDWLNHLEPVDDCHEKTSMQMIGEEHSKESLRIFSHGVEQMMTVMLRHAAKDEGEFQFEEQLEEAGAEPAEEKLSKKEVEQQLSDRIAELESAADWQLNAKKEEEDVMGDLVDLPICREEVQWSRLQKKSQPLEQLDKVIEEIRRMMMNSAQESVNN
jgi:hypothetical protein